MIAAWPQRLRIAGPLRTPAAAGLALAALVALVPRPASAQTLGRGQGPAAAAPAVDFVGFVEGVLRTHPAGDRGQRDVGAAEANVNQAWANLGPTLSGSAQYGRRNAVEFSQPTPGGGGQQSITVVPDTVNRLDLSANQPLFDGRMSGGIQAAKQNRSQARAQASWDLQGLFVQAAERYLDAWVAVERVEAARKDLERAQRALALVREQVALGGADRAAAMQAEIDHLRAGLTVSGRGDTRDRLFASLGEWMGAGQARRPATLPAALPATPPVQPAAGSLAEVLDRRMDLRALREQRDVAWGRRNAALGGFLPRLSVDATLSRDFESGAFSDRGNWQVAGRADWTFLEGGSRAFDTVAKARQAGAALAAYRAAQLRARDDVRVSVERLRQTAAAREVARRTAALAERQYQRVLEQFRGGGATLLELNDARSRVASAQVDDAEQRASLVAAWLHHWRMTGRLVEEVRRRWRVEIPQYLEDAHANLPEE